jgi:hypothetical protein
MQNSFDFSGCNQPSPIRPVRARPPENASVSPKRQAWRAKVVLGRASAPIRNIDAYLRIAMPKFVEDEMHEICQWLAARLAERLDAGLLTIDGMKLFVKQAAEEDDLDLPDAWIDSVAELGYYTWKRRGIDSGALPASTSSSKAPDQAVRNFERSESF